MTSILNKSTVLALNCAHQAVGYRTVRDAIKALCCGLPGQSKPALGVLLDYPIGEDGRPQLHRAQYMGAVGFDEWVKLPIRDGDEFVSTSSARFRVPVFIIEPDYAAMPVVKPKFNRQGILERDGYRCQYSNVVLPPERLTIDHVVPKDRGGKDVWENVVACETKINHRKGNRLNEEVGLKLIRKPFRPKTVPIIATLREVRHPAMREFLVAV